MWQICAGKPYIIVRPDRFVFTMCSTAAELEMAAKQLEGMFSGMAFIVCEYSQPSLAQRSRMPFLIKFSFCHES